ncbi:unnamed protein product [Rangifer tarandus platyrhynchus]|uniref:Uncharacterized protein n=2 Tax=Rangifer tarandus platyrhynchus TaxID=3082113 RepID=A0ABN8ZJ90_RANTA|nr:unnamed protein product [Rangifer tarandus platyrhynchus]
MAAAPPTQPPSSPGLGRLPPRWLAGTQGPRRTHSRSQSPLAVTSVTDKRLPGQVGALRQEPRARPVLSVKYRKTGEDAVIGKRRLHIKNKEEKPVWLMILSCVRVPRRFRGKPQKAVSLRLE